MFNQCWSYPNKFNFDVFLATRLRNVAVQRWACSPSAPGSTPFKTSLVLCIKSEEQISLQDLVRKEIRVRKSTKRVRSQYIIWQFMVDYCVEKKKKKTKYFLQLK